jgi:uncharacterized protein YqeY
MTLQEKVNADIITAMKAKDEASLRALRGLKSALLLAGSEAGANGIVSDEQAIKIFQKLAKQRKESLDIYVQNGRTDLAKTESEELTVIEKYLPAQLSPEQIKQELTALLQANGATSAADFSKVMPIAMKHFAGRADGKIISASLKELLS